MSAERLCVEVANRARWNLLWLNDIVVRNGTMRVDPQAVEETGIRDLFRCARRERTSGPATSELLARVTQAYRILFTRALKSVYVGVPDDETRAYLIDCLGDDEAIGFQPLE